MENNGEADKESMRKAGQNQGKIGKIGFNVILRLESKQHQVHVESETLLVTRHQKKKRIA